LLMLGIGPGVVMDVQKILIFGRHLGKKHFCLCSL
jgi:hypothetical protein